jgi:hypothetical protein
MILTGKNQRTQRKPCPSTTLSTIGPTWTDLDVCGERPVTQILMHKVIHRLYRSHTILEMGKR